MPDDWAAAYLDHRLWSTHGLLGKARSMTTRQNHNFHLDPMYATNSDPHSVFDWKAPPTPRFAKAEQST
jgi:hypothetical protein